MTKPAKLIASYWTLAGPVRPMEGSMVSPLSFRDRAEAAGKAGFDGFGFMQDDLDSIMQSHSYRDIRAILNDNGLVLCEIEALLDWFGKGDARKVSDTTRRRMLDAAEELNAVHIKVGPDLSDQEWDLEYVAEEFAKLCDQARDAGTNICLEMLPDTQLGKLDAATQVVRDAGRRNGGLLLDIWHMTRGHVDFADIAKLPTEMILHIELDDGPAVQVEPFFPETVDRRTFCGEGGFDVDGFLASVKATGYRGTFGVELLSDVQRTLPLMEAAQRAHDTTRQFIVKHFS